MSTIGDRRPVAVVLVVEDDFVLRETICALLNEEGYRTHAAASLAEARSVLAQLDVSVLVLDLMLGGDHGTELLAELSTTQTAPATIIVSAARDAAATAERYDVPLLAKPFDIAALAEAVKRVGREGRRPSGAPRPE